MILGHLSVRPQERRVPERQGEGGRQRQLRHVGAHNSNDNDSNNHDNNNDDDNHNYYAYYYHYYHYYWYCY